MISWNPLETIKPGMVAWLCVAMCWVSNSNAAAESNPVVKDIDPLQASATNHALVLLFLSTECPISNKYAPEVQRLMKKSESSGIKFLLVFPDPTINEADIQKYCSDYKYLCPVMHDENSSLAKKAGAKVTPEVAVYAAGKMVYRGRIDDRFPALGVSRPAPTTHELEEVLQKIIKGETVKFHETRAIGCYIPGLK